MKFSDQVLAAAYPIPHMDGVFIDSTAMASMISSIPPDHTVVGYIGESTTPAFKVSNFRLKDMFMVADVDFSTDCQNSIWAIDMLKSMHPMKLMPQFSGKAHKSVETGAIYMSPDSVHRVNLELA